MDAAGLGGEVDCNFSPRQLAIKEEFIKHRGYWSGFWEDLLALDPDFLEIYQKFSSLPWQRGHLEPKVKEFVYIAIDVATTHLYEPGLDPHSECMRYGATVKKLEVYLLVGILVCLHYGYSRSLDELEKAGTPVETPKG